MAEAGIHDGANNPIPETWLIARCEECGETYELSKCQTRDSGEQTEYECPKDGAAFVVVGPAPALAGYRLKENVVHVPGGMWLKMPNGNVVEFPATRYEPEA